MAYEKPPRTGSTPDTSSLESLKKYSPPKDTIREMYTVVAGNSLSTVAQRAGMEFWEYVDYAFPGCDKNPECVNWYLHYRFDCLETKDGKNRMFRGGEKLPIPYKELEGAPGRLAPVGPGPTPFYLRERAAAYAEKYVRVANPQFVPYGDDCTSFVSQCLLAGGWPMLAGPASSTSSWWYGLGDTSKGLPGDILDWLRNLPRDQRSEVYDSERERGSRSWAAAQIFYDHLTRTGRARTVDSSDALRPGDVVQAMKKSILQVHHTFFVTRRVGTDLRLANHSGRAPIRMLTDVIKTVSDDEALIFWSFRDRI